MSIISNISNHDQSDIRKVLERAENSYSSIEKAKASASEFLQNLFESNNTPAPTCAEITGACLYNGTTPLSTEKVIASEGLAQIVHNAYQSMRSKADALIQAALYGEAKEITVLLERLSPQKKLQALAQQDAEGNTPLALAAYNGKAEAITALLEGLSPQERLQALAQQDVRGNTPLVLAANNGNGEAITALLEGFSPQERLQALAQQDERGNTALVLGASIGETEAITALLEGLSSQERLQALAQQDAPGNMPLALVASHGKAEAITTLIEGFSPQERLQALAQQDGTGNMPLALAAGNGETEAITALLEGLSAQERLQALAQQDAAGNTPLVLGASIGETEAITALLEGLSSQERLQALAQDAAGNTPLAHAASNGKSEAITALLEGLSAQERLQALAQQDAPGNTPLTLAAGNGKAEAITALLEGFSPQERLQALNQFDSNGNTAVIVALDLNEASFNNLIRNTPNPRTLLTEGLNQWNKPLIRARLGLETSGTYAANSYSSLEETLASLSSAQLLNNNPRALRAREDFSRTLDFACMPAEDVADAILNGERVVILTGWTEHSTAIVFSDNLVMKCNRGEGSTDADSGVTVFEMKELPSREELIEVITILRKDQSQEYFCSTIDTDLRLRPAELTDQEKEFTFRSPQKVGNCSIASARAAFAALLFDEFREDLPSAAQFYKTVTETDRIQALDKAIEYGFTHDEEFMNDLRKKRDSIAALFYRLKEKHSSEAELHKMVSQTNLIDGIDKVLPMTQVYG